MNQKLSGKNVLITAGAQGIGEAITQQFIDSGANVAIHYFSSSERADELTQSAKAKGLKAVSIQGDLTKEADAQSVVCLLYTSPSPRDRTRSRMPSSA